AILGLARRYGPICAVGVRPMRYVFLFGPDAHRELFTSDIDRFSWRGAMKALIPVDGETALVVSDGDDHQRRRRIVQPAFNIRRIEGYVPIMAEEAARTIGRWQVGDVVDVYEDLRACVRRIVIR